MRTRHSTTSIVNSVKDHAYSSARTKDQKMIVVPSGSTLINLACSDTSYGAFKIGGMTNIIGDSFSGKTLLCLSAMAEMSTRKRFENYRMILDDAEEANEFDIKRMFGSSLAEKIEPPARDKDGDPVNSGTIQDFHHNVRKALSNEKPCIYVLDSFDSLTSDEEEVKVSENMLAREKGNKTKGSYGMDKPKYVSQMLRMIDKRLKQTGSILIIISQTRDNIDPMSFVKKTRSGGRALKFYASHEIWLAAGGKTKVKDRIIETECVVKVTKNKITGKERTVKIRNLIGYGIDDIGSCVDWLVTEGFWKEKGQKIIAKDLDLFEKRAKLIRSIEEQGMEKRLKKIIEEAWTKLESSLLPNRKAKYE